MTDLPIPGLDFSAPHGFAGGPPLGCRVLLPWRGETRLGLVVGEGDPRELRRTREVIAVLDSPERPWVRPSTVRALGAWAQAAALPAGLAWGDFLGVGWDSALDHTVRAVPGADLSAFGAQGRAVPGDEWQPAGAYGAAELDHIREQGLLEERVSLRPRRQRVIRARERVKVPPAARTEARLAAQPWEAVEPALRVGTELYAVPGPHRLTPKQAAAHAWLAEHGPVPGLREWAAGSGASGAILKKLLAGGAAALREGPAPPPPAWEWLRARGSVAHAREWAAGAGVPLREVSRILEGGGADYVFRERPDPPAWAWLREHGPQDSLSAWAAGAGVSGAVVGRLLNQGWAEAAEVPAPPPPLPAPVAPDWGLDVEELLSLAADTLPEEAVWRLHGGRAAQRFAALAPRVARLLAQGRGVLVLAPDYATLGRAWDALSGLAPLVGTRGVQFTGLLGPAQREEAWRLIGEGEARLVIGSPLALCAPLPDLGLVVVLEEASDAYKLLSGSRAFVPDVAARVAAEAGASLAYVGGVPAVESVPVGGVVLAPPRTRLHVVDYSRPPEQPELGPLSGVHLTPGDLGYPLSHDLARLLRQVQERGRQAALLAPRRGYSALLRCPSCEAVPQCRNCDIPLRFHQETRELSCHQCGYHQGVPERCEECGERMWRARGPGTEWIEQELRRLLPGFPVYRVDKDHQDDLGPLLAGEPGVVVGTQLLLSRPAPPNLALLGVTLADTWLGVSDFRASERYHRLLRQLAEWHPSRAPLLVVQTFQGDHPALRVLVEGRDALAYPQAEERVRRELHYPPAVRLAQVEVAARDRERARAAADAVAQGLYAGGATSAEVLGPAPSPVARLRGAYLYHLFLRARSEARLAELLAVLGRQTWAARVRVDVNPRSSWLDNPVGSRPW